jgi:ketosteroid isomerase-like protein
MAASFDFPAFKRAFEAKDVEAWMAFFAPDAEWGAYRPDAPPRSPITMGGRAAIRATLADVASTDLEQVICDEVLGEERVAFAFLVTLPDGRHSIEHVILHPTDGKIARQVDVEMRD